MKKLRCKCGQKVRGAVKDQKLLAITLYELRWVEDPNKPGWRTHGISEPKMYSVPVELWALIDDDVPMPKFGRTCLGGIAGGRVTFRLSEYDDSEPPPEEEIPVFLSRGLFHYAPVEVEP